MITADIASTCLSPFCCCSFILNSIASITRLKQGSRATGHQIALDIAISLLIVIKKAIQHQEKENLVFPGTRRGIKTAGRMGYGGKIELG